MSHKHGIFWLASYPKSGNTWLRIVLYHVLNPTNNITINQISTGEISSSRHFLDEILGFDSSDFSHAELDQLRPLIYQQHARQINKIGYHKTHDAYTFVDNNQPLIPTAGCLGAVYLIRNPLDVVGSYANHSNTSIANTIKMMNQKNHALCKSNQTVYPQVRHKLLSWSEHVKSWTTIQEFPVLIMRYEDLLQNPIDNFAKIINFLQVEYTEQNILDAIANSNITKLQQQEQEFGFNEKPPNAKIFFRKGIANDWKNTLNAQQITEVIEHHGDIMQKHGYLDSQFNPIL